MIWEHLIYTKKIDTYEIVPLITLGNFYFQWTRDQYEFYWKSNFSFFIWKFRNELSIESSQWMRFQNAIINYLWPDPLIPFAYTSSSFTRETLWSYLASNYLAISLKHTEKPVSNYLQIYFK